MFVQSSRGSADYLFSRHDLRDIVDSHRAAVAKDVEALDADRLLNTSATDLVEFLVKKYTLDVPALRRELWSASEHETQIDVRHDPMRWITDRSRPCLIPGQRFEVEVPFEGDADLLHAKASTYSNAAPTGQVRGQSIFLTFDVPGDGPERDIKKEVDGVLGRIDEHLRWTQNDAGIFNQALPDIARAAVESRRQRLLANRGRAASLGIPLKARADAPRASAAPPVRRKVLPAVPAAKSSTYEPEPELDMANYEHILSVMQDMTVVMERSPSAFEQLDEEALRQHFLVQLNGHFEGGATGETFNVNGKTDILLRASGRNVFIAECKFWRGPKQFREAIDQLLSYTAWRDSKTAIVMFNRGTAMSTILKGIQSEAISHGNYKRQVTSYKHESGFRYVFHHTADPNREFLMTVLVFDVPSPHEPEDRVATS